MAGAKARGWACGLLVLALGVADLVLAAPAGLPTGARVLLAVSAVTLLIMLGVTGLLVSTVVRPLRALTSGVQHAVHESLPAAVSAIAAGMDGPAPPPLPEAGRNGRLAELTEAISRMQSDVLALATARQRTERVSADMLITLARRNQSLLNRALHHISELERTEQDAAVLERLLRLEHATTRIRRNAESMLVLGGAAPTRSTSRSTAVIDVLRSALSEIEDHTRVDITVITPAAVAGSVLADLVHLLAELIENATHFSPPSARVVVTGEPVTASGGYLIRIVDNGVGMTGPDLDDALTRIRGSGRGRTSAHLLGLDVVGILATRHDMVATLESRPGAGTTATVTVPTTALAPLSSLPVVRPAPAGPVGAAFGPGAGRPHPTPAGDPVKPLKRPRSPVGAGVPRRVRGAQLPDLGPAGDGAPPSVPDARRVGSRLNALQVGLTAARTSNIPPSPQPHPALPAVEAPRPGPVAGETP